MMLALLAILGGFMLLVWSADRFVEGAASTAKYAGMPALLIGMVVVGFGTSAPEMVVSAMAASDGNPALALGNGMGSNIVNISLILGVTALIAPIAVQSSIVRKELPILIVASFFFGCLIFDGDLSSLDATLLLVGFLIFITWSIYSGLYSSNDALETEFTQEINNQTLSLQAAIFWLLVGLILLVLSSRVLVWGAVEIATALGVSDLIIGLTIVALGTSLPELAASIVAAKKGEHDIAIGNVVGSNMFNTLAVIGIAGGIEPIMQIEPMVFNRDWSVMMILTIMLFVMAFGFGRQGRITRKEGAMLLLSYFAYSGYLIFDSFSG
ncbi:calcium/sodium antiporter [Pseudoalteromonas maricaloris]|uniref:calcium/sodium antiporter n=1 Tax=Pseudoalteromonas maricaloris TaxID=184924 RepID=UPI00029A5FBF|nr:calcium/sodium antiporter [Pseudoalteromonas flavipulchra]